MSKKKANRLNNYDYSQAGYYFVTICTKERINYFGEIEKETMQSNNMGLIAKQCWQVIPEHFPNTALDEFVVMPNHIHGIVIIHHQPVGNADLRSLRNDRSKMGLSKIIHGFKSTVTRIVHQSTENHPFAWQKSFHDHIVRNDEALHRIRAYIQHNPLKWALDKDNPDNWMER